MMEYLDKTCEWLESEPILHSLTEFRDKMIEYAAGNTSVRRSIFKEIVRG